MQNQNQVQKRKPNLSVALSSEKMNKMLHETIGNKKDAFVADLLALSNMNDKLTKVDPGELVKCAMAATALDLPLNPSLGYAYVIPYELKANQYRDAKTEAQFQIGYKGLIQLAIRSGQYKHINAVEVREGEMKRNKFTGAVDFIGEKPDNEIIGYVAFIELLNGFQQSVYMSTEELIDHADKYSMAFNKKQYIALQEGTIPQNQAWKLSSPWYKQFDMMAKKTVLKQVLTKYGVLSVKMQEAIRHDQTNAEGQYNDNPSERLKVDAVVEDQDLTGSDPVAKEQPIDNDTSNKPDGFDFDALANF